MQLTNLFLYEIENFNGWLENIKLFPLKWQEPRFLFLNSGGLHLTQVKARRKIWFYNKDDEFCIDDAISIWQISIDQKVYFNFAKVKAIKAGEIKTCSINSLHPTELEWIGLSYTKVGDYVYF